MLYSNGYYPLNVPHISTYLITNYCRPDNVPLLPSCPPLFSLLKSHKLFRWQRRTCNCTHWHSKNVITTPPLVVLFTLKKGLIKTVLIASKICFQKFMNECTEEIVYKFISTRNRHSIRHWRYTYREWQIISLPWWASSRAHQIFLILYILCIYTYALKTTCSYCQV